MEAFDILSHASPRRLRRHEYDHLVAQGCFEGERVELVHGIVLTMSPIRPSHADPVDVLARRLLRQLDETRAVVRVQQPFVIGDNSEPEPDLALVPPGRYRSQHPDEAFLVIEVAESSLAHDRQTKAPLYAEAGVPEYWIVNVAASHIEVYDRPADGRYARTRTFAAGAELFPHAFEDVRISVDELFR